MPDTVINLRVRYAETDQMGVVYHANYYVWFEIARTELLRTLGWTYREMEADGVWLPVVESRCHHHRPVRYDDELNVRVRGRLLSPVRVVFEYEVVRQGDAEIAATGATTHAATTPGGRPCRLPERVRELLSAST